MVGLRLIVSKVDDLKILAFILLLLPSFVYGNGLKLDSVDKDLHIYILAGQSNMAGRGAVDGIYKKLGHDRVLVLDSNGVFVKAHHPLHYDKPKIAGVGPGLSFGMYMAEENKDVKIALVPCAVGGTPINKWQPGAYDTNTKTHPYDDAIAKVRKAMESGVIKGVLWHQGEGDSNPEKAKTYLQKLHKLVKRIRSEVGDPKLPFVIGELARYRDSYQLVNEELREVGSIINNAIVVSSEGLWHKGDGTHFDSASASELGVRFAEGMRKLQRGNSNDEDDERSKYTTLSEAEIADGWKLLFDGVDPNTYWMSVNGFSFPNVGWKVEDEMLVLLPGQKGKDIMTREKFSQFELVLDFKLTNSANTGIKYFVTYLKDQKGRVRLNGPEYQLIDDHNHDAVKSGESKGSTAALYLLYAPKNKKLKAAGEWNQAKIVARKKKVEHWLNGEKVLEYERGSQDLLQRVSQTKFKELNKYGEVEAGHILLQDHKDQVYFRNIKIRRLD